MDDDERWTLHSDPDNAQVVAPASDGGAWMVSRAAGLVRWHDATTYQRHPLDERLAKWTGTAAAGEGAVWMVAHRHGGEGEPSGTVLARFDGREWTIHPLDERLTHLGVGALAVDDGGDVWVGFFQTERGDAGLGESDHAPAVARFDGRTWTLYAHDDGLPVGDVHSLTTDDRGGVWVVTVGHHDDAGEGGVARFDDQGWTSWSFDEVPADDVRSVAARGGSVWALARTEPRRPQEPPEPEDLPPSPSHSLLRFDGSGWTAAITDDGLPEGRLGNLAVDGAGVPWLVVHQRYEAPRLVRFGGGGWITHTTADGLPTAEVRAVTGDEAGGLWAATPGGVARFDGDAWTAFTTGDEGPPGDVLTAVAATDEAVWAAVGGRMTGGFGILWPRFVDGEWITDLRNDELPSRDVHAVAAGDDGTVWAGTDRGIARFDGVGWRDPFGDGPLGLSDPMARTGVGAVAAAGDHTAWFGGGFGLAWADGRDWTIADRREPARGRRSVGAVFAIALTDEAVWAGTDRGLASLRVGR